MEKESSTRARAEPHRVLLSEHRGKGGTAEPMKFVVLVLILRNFLPVVPAPVAEPPALFESNLARVCSLANGG